MDHLDLIKYISLSLWCEGNDSYLNAFFEFISPFLSPSFKESFQNQNSGLICVVLAVEQL